MGHHNRGRARSGRHERGLPTDPDAARARAPGAEQGRADHGTEHVDALRLRAWQGFLFAHAQVTRVLGAELEAVHSMPLSWYDVLVNLDEAPDNRLQLHHLAERMVLSQSGVTRLMDRLEAAGLVERVPCERDARVTYAALTQAGRAALVDAAVTHHRGIAAYFAAHVTDHEAAALASAFDRILEALDSARRPR